MNVKIVSVLCAAVVLTAACAHQSPGQPSLGPVGSVADGRAGSVSIMTFNVENLFDTTHDVDKDDYTFLPIASKETQEHKARCNKISVKSWREQCLYWDWSQAALDYKLRMIGEVILRVNNGQGPDVIAFQEVENVGILERLRTEVLADAGYLPAVLVEGNDLRGIDVAFLSRLPVVGTPVLHPIDFESISERRRADTRGILQTDFQLPDGTVLTGYSVHFPAPFHPYKLRIDAYKSLNALIEDLPEDRPVFAAGDFNTPSLEDEEHQLLDRFAKPQWIIAHQVGCTGCPGTSYYPPKDDWSFLDMIMVRASSDVSARWSLNRNATRLANSHPQQKDESGYPRRFSVSPLGGVSDHWPIVIELKRR